MYQVIDNKIAVRKKDLLAAGLTANQIKKDSSKGLIKVCNRGILGDTLFYINGYEKRPSRLSKIEAALGRIEDVLPREAKPAQKKEWLFKFVPDMEARAFFQQLRKPDGSHLSPERLTEYENRASLFEAIRRGLEECRSEHAKRNRKLRMGDFWEKAAEWCVEMSADHRFKPLGNARALERAFKSYLKGGYASIIHKNIGNDGARIVSFRMEKLLLALWTANNRPFVKEVHEIYMEFVSGSSEFFDRKTGELFRPEEFRYVPKNGGDPRPLEISVPTVWNCLKDHINDASTSSKRDGNYIAVVEKRPYHLRKSPIYSMSKISMDDADLSRKMKDGGTVHRYMSYDVASGYWFTPVYSREPLTADDVVQCFRNMFCEIEQLGLPSPGEVEHEHHLVDSIIDDLRVLFPFVTISSHSRNKRAEHAIKSLKWGVAHQNGHTNGRFYCKGSYRKPLITAQLEICQGQSLSAILCDLSDIGKTYTARRYAETHRNAVYVDCCNDAGEVSNSI